MQVDCGVGSDLYVSVVANKSSFVFDALTYYVDGPSTVNMTCAGFHDLVVSGGSSYLIQPSSSLQSAFGMASSITSLNNTINQSGLSPDAFLFITGVLTALAFVAGLKMRL